MNHRRVELRSSDRLGTVSITRESSWPLFCVGYVYYVVVRREGTFVAISVRKVLDP